ncbi:Pre-rRNA-processing protein fhl1 [Mycoblastus sanguinarius]|nr:Pre-rRNA-processing protein fhl1 [Mycoblastus sanguinarius]
MPERKFIDSKAAQVPSQLGSSHEKDQKASSKTRRLTKPTTSQTPLIHDALSSPPTVSLSLDGIDKAVIERHSYYRSRAEIRKWQSSVSHNLGQNPGFRRRAIDGKLWEWGYETSSDMSMLEISMCSDMGGTIW